MKIINKIVLVSAYLIIIIVLSAAIDIFIFHNRLGFAGGRVRTSSIIQHPYIGFTEKRIASSEPYSIYYDGSNIYKNNENKIRIAFFGGSTGAFSDPETPDSLTIPEYLEQRLKERLKKDAVVINYSAGGAHHHQHLHMLLEFMPRFKPDIVLYYGGNNETIQAFMDDPRPFYPFNFFYQAEVPVWQKFLFEYSALFSCSYENIETYIILKKLRDKTGFTSPEWYQQMTDSYFKTLELSNEITKTFKSDIFGSAVFISVFQPLNLSYSSEWEIPVKMIRDKLPSVPYAYDFFHMYDKFPKGIYYDNCHVRDEANRFMADKLADLLIEKHLSLYKK